MSVVRRVGTRLLPGQLGILALGSGPAAVAVGSLAVTVAAGGALVDNYLVVDVAMAVVAPLIGALLVSRLPRNPMGWLFCLTGAAYALAAVATAWVGASQRWGWWSLTGAAWLGEWAYAPALGTQMTLLLLLFPDGRPPAPRWRPLVWVSGLVVVALTVTFMFVPELHATGSVLISNPVGLAAADAVVGALLVLLIVTGLLCGAALVGRMRRGDEEERRRIAPYVAAAVLVAAALVGARAAPDLEPLVQTLFLPLLPVSAAVCILRYRLYDLELVVRRSLVWVGLTVAVVGGYALVVEATANLLRREAGLPESLLAAGVVAAAFQPVRVVLQRAVSRSLYGHRDDPYAALGRLGQALAITAEPFEALQRAADNIAEALALPWVAIDVVGDGDVQPLVQSGRRPRWVTDAVLVRVPLVHSAEMKGHLVVSGRSPREALSPRDRQILDGLSFAIAAATAAARLTEDLRSSRRRLVLAREEERRRLRHELHDGLGPLLASLPLQLDAATLRMARAGLADPEPLDDLRSTISEAIAAVRRAVEDLRPPVLDELGLVDAITEQANRLGSAGGPRLDVHATEPLPPLPAAVEVAAYRIAIEAVTNAIRHADAAAVAVALDVSEEPAPSLRLEIRDDGHGVHGDHHPGIGMASMRARAEELGGTWTMEVDGQGTIVRACLPAEVTR